MLETCTGLTWACARPTVRMVYSRPARRRYPVPCTHAPAPPLRAQAWPSCAARGAGRGSSGHPRRSGVVPARRWSAKSNAHRLPKRDRARRSDAESLPTKRSCALHAASESPPSTCRRGDMSGESSYLDDVIIRGRSRASDVPDAHPEPEQRLERLVPSVSPVGSRHGLSADFVARSLRTRPDLGSGPLPNRGSVYSVTPELRVPTYLFGAPDDHFSPYLPTYRREVPGERARTTSKSPVATPRGGACGVFQCSNAQNHGFSHDKIPPRTFPIEDRTHQALSRRFRLLTPSDAQNSTFC